MTNCFECGYGYPYYPDVGATDVVCQHPDNPSGLGACPLDKLKEDASARIGKFHAHLDICEQCERHPFDLCQEGAKLLKYAATGQ